MLGAVEDIVRLGRNYGSGCMLLSQRPQSVNKEVLNQVECLFVGQINEAHARAQSPARLDRREGHRREESARRARGARAGGVLLLVALVAAHVQESSSPAQQTNKPS